MGVSTEASEMTGSEAERQDIVDNGIFHLVNDLAGVNAEDESSLEWDISWISEIREAVQAVICGKLELMTEMEFYPYRES